MSTFQQITPPGAAGGQRGMSLVIVMVLLLVMSVLGIAILRSSAMQERMSANMRDRSLAFQTTETALREAQDNVLGVQPDPDDPDVTWDNWTPDNQSCNNEGLCAAGSEPSWQAGPSLQVPTGGPGQNVTTPSEYWMEDLGVVPGESDPDNHCLVYLRDASANPPANCQSRMLRVTARSSAEGRAEVVLQANVVNRVPALRASQ